MSIRNACFGAIVSVCTATAVFAQSSVTADVYNDVTGVNVEVRTGDATTSSFRVFNSASTELLRVTASGNVGIGEPNPIVRLHVVGDARFMGGPNKGAILTDTINTNPTLTLRVGDAAGYYPTLRFAAEDNSFIGSVFGYKGGALLLQSGANHYIGFRPNNAATDVMVISAQGRVGIGTPLPSAQLNVVGDAHIVGGPNRGGIFTDTTTTNPSLTLRVGDATGYFPLLRFAAEDNSTIGLVRGYKGGGLLIESATNHYIGFRPNNATTDLMVISAQGRVGIGTPNPGATLQVHAQQFGHAIRAVDDATMAQGWGPGVVFVAKSTTEGAYADFALIRGAKLNGVSGNTAGKMMLQVNNGAGAQTEIATFTATSMKINGDADFSGTVTGTKIQAHYQDVAEWVPSRHDLVPGTVVVLDPQLGNGVAASTAPYDTAVAGVVSAQPGIILGEASDMKEMVATTGRVRVKVDARRAAIAVGDLLVTSEEPGMAMKSEPIEISGRKFHQPGTIIGKALESLPEGQGEILVLLSLQ